MDIGDSFRVEYKLASMRNFIRNSKIEGQFRAAQDGENTVRVCKVG
jgi:hypothetical protein